LKIDSSYRFANKAFLIERREIIIIVVIMISPDLGRVQNEIRLGETSSMLELRLMKYSFRYHKINYNKTNYNRGKLCEILMLENKCSHPCWR